MPETAGARLSIIILNFHGLSDTLACLETLQRADLHGARVLVLENGSGASEVAAIEQWNEGAGFFGVVENLASARMDWARTRGARFFW